MKLAFGLIFGAMTLWNAAWSQAFNPRDLTAMPSPSQIPASAIPADRLSSECLRYFNKAHYQGSLGGDKIFWPGVVDAKFTTTGQVSHDDRLNRLTCKLNYSWATKYNSGPSNIVVAFDGKWVIGRNVIMETKGSSLLVTIFRDGGLKSWATYERQ